MPSTMAPVAPEFHAEPEPSRLQVRRPALRWLLWPAMAFLSLGGFVGGVSLVFDRTGEGLQADLAWLEHTPVHDFFLPGLFILVVYGAGTFLAIAGMVTRRSPGRLARIDARLGVHWSLALTITIGAVLVVWILYEFLIFTATVWLQPVLIVVGAIMVGVPLVPSMRRWYAA